MRNALVDLSSIPHLQGLWVAIDPRGRTNNDRETPLKVALHSGAVIVDADGELDVLCARLKDDKRTSLTIVYNGKRPA